MDWLNAFRQRRRRSLLERILINDEIWGAVSDDVSGRYRISRHEQQSLRELASLFLHRKHINGAAGGPLSNHQCAIIAARACIPILGLDIDWYDGWIEIIVYPDSFVPRHEYVDENGLVHEEESIRDGESWDQGPVILSWAGLQGDSDHADQPTDLVIHEFSHKLDQLNGVSNGHPPLHADMSTDAWSHTMEQAFTRLQAFEDRWDDAPIDPYGAENPAEFFAVVSEYFFIAPGQLIDFDPALYDQLKRFYKQDPAKRFGIRN